MAKDHDVISFVQDLQQKAHYKDLTWQGTFQQYLDIVEENPLVARSAYQRLFDMIMMHDTYEYFDSRKKVVHYKFFDDEDHGGKDALYGLDIPLMKLINVFKSAALGYGTERRIILLHGPVGCAKSTICRLIKRGLEDYSKKPEGALYSYHWVSNGDSYIEKELLGGLHEFPCPMHEEPLLLIPEAFRQPAFRELTKGKKLNYTLKLDSELCPPCRYIFKELMIKYKGDWQQVLNHVKVLK